MFDITKRYKKEIRKNFWKKNNEAKNDQTANKKNNLDFWSGTTLSNSR